MPYIYKIKNEINNKIYIGKTMLSVDKRWLEHCRDYKRKRYEKRPLYSAMKKYGIENFSIECIEECSDDILSEREVYWIEYYDSFKNGYNATSGGDGKRYIDYDIVVSTYLQTNNQKQTAKILNIDNGTVRKILKARNIEISKTSEINKKKLGTEVNMFSLSGEYIKSFPSAREAAVFILPEQHAASGRIASKISDVCKGNRNTAYNYKWSYDTNIKK